GPGRGGRLSGLSAREPPCRGGRPPMMDFWKVAHRGRHDSHLENTLEAFRAAYAAGCDMVEFDVQLSRDGVPVVFHDDDCRRLAGRGESVFDLSWDDLRRMELRWKPGRQGPVYRM